MKATATKLGPLQCKSFNTLCAYLLVQRTQQLTRANGFPTADKKHRHLLANTVVLVSGFPLYVSFLDAINSRSVTNVAVESENATSPSFTSMVLV